MSYKSKIIKMAIRWTPSTLIIWVANKILKEIAELNEFNFDLDNKKAYLKTTLYGETEAIEVWLQDFAISHDGENYHFALLQTETNKPWLKTIFSYITGKSWKIPVIPQLAPYMPLIAEVFANDRQNAQEAVNVEPIAEAEETSA